MRNGDSLVVDRSIRFDGYWSDSYATDVAGALTVRQREIHSVVARALAHVMSLVRPGVRANEVDHDKSLDGGDSATSSGRENR